MPKYPWKCLKKLFWLCQGSEYAWWTDRFDRLLRIPEVLKSHCFLNMSHLFMEEFWICLFMAPYALIMPQYALMCFHMPEHDWILLNGPEYVWINCSYSAMVLNMLQYSYNNIIIVTNVIRILVFLICTSRHSSIILSIFNTSYNIRITKASKLSINFSFWLQWWSI